MPGFVIGAAIAAGIATGVGVAVGTVAATAALSFFGTSFLVSASIGAISTLMAKKPQDPGVLSFNAQGRTVTIRQAISPWEVVLGRTRKGGVITAYYESADRKYVHLVITLACHRVQSIDEIWFNDEVVALDANGFAFGKWAKTDIEAEDEISQALAVIPGSPYQVTVADFGTFHSAGLQHVVARMTDVSPAAPAARHEFSRSGGTFTFHSSAEGLTYAINYFSASSTTASMVRIKKSLGDEGPGVQPFPDFVAESNGYWTEAKKQYGHAKIYVRLQAAPEVFPAGIPNITVVMKGALMFDPRTDATAYSENAALAINHVLVDSDYGFGADYTEEVNDADLVSAANSSEEDVTRALGGTERRYVVGGSYTLAETPREVLGRLLGACAGTLVNIGDQWHINVGVYHAPTVTLDEDHVAGATTVNAFQPTRESCTGVRGVYIEPSKNWQPVPFPPVESTSAVEDAEGEALWKEVDYSKFVTSSGQAQRLAKIDLLRSLQSLSEDGVFKPEAWKVVPGRSVARTDSDMCWTEKAFEVLDSRLQLAPGKAGSGPVIVIGLQLRETAAAVYDWATNEDGEADLAPNTALPDPGEVPVPGNPSVTEENHETRDGRGVATRATVSTLLSTYPFGATYQFEYKLTSASAYTLLPTVRVIAGATGNVSVVIEDIAPGRYDFRVRAFGLNGAASAYATTSNKEIVGLSEVPEDPVIRGLQAAGDGITCTLTLEPHPALDVRRGGRWRVRHTDGDTPEWSQSLSIGDAEGYVGDQTIIALPLKPGTYLVKAEDALGQLSSGFASIFVKQAAVLDFTTVHTITEDTAFTGTKDGLVAVDSLIKLDSDGLVDDIVDWDAISSLDGYGGVVAEGTYTFANASNFGAVTRVRLTSQIVGQAVNVNDLIDDRTDNIDDWADFDGDADGGGLATDAWIEMRETDDNPSGTPTWSDWKRLDSAAVEAWGVQYRLRIISSDAAYNRHVNQCRVVAEQVA